MEELIDKARKGDKEAFTKIILENEQSLYKIAKIRLINDYDICEALQNTMILAYKHIKKLKDVKYFKTWIIKILINECNKIYKKKGKNITLEENYMMNIEDTKDEYENIDNKLTFDSIIKKLNYDEREIIIMYYSLEFSIKEISKVLHIKENTIKTKMRRAKIKVREEYKEG